MNPGIHHVTAIASDPQRNLDFYAGVLGLRLVKLTVNFDDPDTYHVYYGDALGRPGSLMTFFHWPGGPRGRAGSRQARAVSFSIPEGASEYWVQRLQTHGILFEVHARFGDEVISFSDPDRLRLELVAASDDREAFTDGPVPGEHSIRGLYGVTLAEEESYRTATVLGAMGWRSTGESGGRMRFVAGRGGSGAVVDVENLPGLRPGRVAAGTIHHVAFRTPDQAAQESLREEILRAGLKVTPAVDRRYFRSIYFREPGGVRFEIATDGPGFAVDEPAAALGTRLMLPPWLEARRPQLEKALPALRLPALVKRA
jgi:catechol 2,3-dioxygenase-like lactoylglutathione lyase family enzyme